MGSSGQEGNSMKVIGISGGGEKAEKSFGISFLRKQVVF